MPEQAALLSAVLAAIPDPAILLDRRATVMDFNPAAKASWPTLSRNWPLSFTLRSPDVVDAVEAVARGAPVARAQLGERVPVERVFALTVTALSPVGDDARMQPAMLLVLRDMTESRRLELMRVDFVANASHELRTPLASLLGFIETLQGPARDDTAARERFLAIMRTQAQRMARLIDDLLSLSRVEMSEHRHPEEPVDLLPVAGQVVDSLRPLAQERGVALELAGAPGLVVAGARDELVRVAENLVENAIKYGAAGGRVVLGLSEEAGEAGAPAAVLSVRDFGPGIAPEHLPRLTERFYRVDAGDSRDKGGTGLGLAIVKHIVNRHRGRLAIESRLGEGTTVRVTIPIRQAAAPANP